THGGDAHLEHAALLGSAQRCRLAKRAEGHEPCAAVLDHPARMRREKALVDAIRAVERCGERRKDTLPINVHDALVMVVHATAAAASAGEARRNRAKRSGDSADIEIDVFAPDSTCAISSPVIGARLTPIIA